MPTSDLILAAPDYPTTAISYELQRSFVSTDGVYLRGTRYGGTTDGSGNATTAVPVPDDGTAEYILIIGTKKTAPFYPSATSSANVATLLDLPSLSVSATSLLELRVTALEAAAPDLSSYATTAALTTEATSRADADSALQQAVDSKATPASVASAVGTHATATTGIHGIADTAALVITSDSRLPLNVMAFGATGDGTTDDTAALQAALAAAASQQRPLYLPTPAVAYVVTSSLTPASRTIIEGSGASCLLRWQGAAHQPLFNLSSTTNGSIRNLAIQGVVAAAGARVGIGLLCDATYSWTLAVVSIAYLETGIVFRNNAGDTNAINAQIRSCDVGVLADSSVNYLHGGVIADCTTGIADSADGGAIHCTAVTWSGTSSQRHIDLTHNGGMSVFMNCWLESAQVANARLGNGTSGPQGVTFNGCFFSCPGGSVNLDLQAGADGTKIANNRLNAPATITISSGHDRALLWGNSPVSGNLTINDSSGNALIDASQTASPGIDFGRLDMRGGDSGTPWTLKAAASSGGVGFRAQAKDNTGTYQTVWYTEAGVASPRMVLPLGVVVTAGTSRFDSYIKLGNVAALPTASSVLRGQVIRVEGGAGVADKLYICEKNASDAYAWRQL
ncbi:MAG TPA: glycosyl hydrolase family 28-related protein [Roseiflexaceae bacterium]|nr:glycosyl hydrolase family 28-related protein [Roseiflexaceae bacterium]